MQPTTVSGRLRASGNDWQTIAISLALIITGLLLIGGDLAGLLSLDRILNLWPVTLITVGFSELLPRQQ